ncbi:hypothetical protein BJ741DRAFT_358787 [Chytriomyces cf. hyalinus JEL632]|nr:hypothetical protein BJ741DRAFT_358787 [Chytriomyces cf. hyalinus JEL632]
MSNRQQFQSLQAQRPLPNGWRAEWSSNHNCFYFVDPSGACTWHDPRDSPPIQAAASAASVASKPMSQLQDKQSDQVRRPNSAAATAAAFQTASHAAPSRNSTAVINSIHRPLNAQTTAARQRTLDPKKKFCGCFSTRSSCCIFWSVFTFILLAGIAVAGFFLWPRSPTVTISEPYIPSTIAPIQIAGSSLASASASNPATIILNMAVDVTVFSPNYIDIFVSKISFQGQLINPLTNTNMDSAPVNGIATNVNFRSKKTTAFTLMFTVTHPITSGAALQILTGTDEVIHTVVNECSSSNGKLPMAYNIQLSISAISWTGFKPMSSGKASIPCPASATELINLLT